jgi:hypothetical protein
MKTAMQELIEYIEMNPIVFNKELLLKLKELTFVEKEQIQKAFSDGQETPINHPILPHYSREEYYKNNYNSTTSYQIDTNEIRN